MKPTTFNRENVKINIARLKKGGQVFEIVLNPDKIVDIKEGKLTDYRDAVESLNVFSDAKRGLAAPQNYMNEAFGTTDKVKIIETIIKEGEVQLTQEYREKIRNSKKNMIIDIIARNAIDPRTNLPHPRTRIEAAFEDSKARIDEFKDAKSQVNDIIKALRPILPIKFAVKEIIINIPPQYAGASIGIVRRLSKITEESWLNDGSWSAKVEIPAGLQNEFFDQLNRLTHGDFQSEINDK